MRFLRRLFQRSPKAAPIDEQEAYARTYGERSGEIVRVEHVTVAAPQPAPPPQLPDWEDLTGELLRRAFESRLDARR